MDHCNKAAKTKSKRLDRLLRPHIDARPRSEATDTADPFGTGPGFDANFATKVQRKDGSWQTFNSVDCGAERAERLAHAEEGTN